MFEKCGFIQNQLIRRPTPAQQMETLSQIGDGDPVLTRSQGQDSRRMLWWPSTHPLHLGLSIRGLPWELPPPADSPGIQGFMARPPSSAGSELLVGSHICFSLLVRFPPSASGALLLLWEPESQAAPCLLRFRSVPALLCHSPGHQRGPGAGTCLLPLRALLCSSWPCPRSAGTEVMAVQVLHTLSARRWVPCHAMNTPTWGLSPFPLPLGFFPFLPSPSAP